MVASGTTLTDRERQARRAGATRGRSAPDSGHNRKEARQRARADKQRAKAERATKPRPWPLRWLPRRRLAVVYDISGPKVRLGILWFLANLAGLAVGLELMTPLWAITAFVAGMQASRAWRRRGVQADRVVAGGGAALIAVTGTLTTSLVGIAILLVVAASYYMALIDLKRGNPVTQASYTLQCALLPGLAAAGVLMTLRFDLIAASGLILLVSAYESGDFLIGSGARWKWEGPVMGMIATTVMAFAVSTLRLPPFVLPEALWLGGLAAVLCPVGQLVASAVLPDAGSRASAVRRLDSMMILAPVWALVTGILTV